MRFLVTVRKLNVTDRQTDGQTDRRGALQYLPSRAFGAAGDNKYFLLTNHKTHTLYVVVNPDF